MLVIVSRTMYACIHTQSAFHVSYPLVCVE